MQFLACVALSVVLVAQGARYRRSKREKGRHGTQVGSGRVDGLYTFGAPRSAVPGLVNPGNFSCLPGLRSWTGQKYFVVSQFADQIPMLPAPVRYQHPMMDVAEFDVSSLSNPEVTQSSCSKGSQDTPWYRVGNMLLHARTPYVNAAYKVSSWLGNVTDMGAMQSYFQDPGYVAQRVKGFGWRLAGSAYHEGGSIDGGPQVLYLMQHPSTLECLMTFQGTNSIQDVVVDVQAQKAHFCGLVERGESCGLFESCKPNKAGGSFVHKGFRDHLRRMIKCSDWQNKIRPSLPKCRKVWVAGHSLGGAMGELFTTCVARAPQPGQYGYEEDYKYMYWNRGTPARLPYL
jgi:hypothetical protein